ncbi:MAG TPA: acyltransferase [Bacteroidales bacterium]|nr:acyltransferase [Bacteroidales bacterium]
MKQEEAIDSLLRKKLFNTDPGGFEALALEVFRFQYAHCDIYNQWCRQLGVRLSQVSSLEQIPFLPVEFFRTHKVLSLRQEAELVFSSSGTTSAMTSRHWVADPNLYETSYLNAFRLFYGMPEDYVILALLPSYLERGGSSLVYMADGLIRLSGRPESGFYLNNLKSLDEMLHSLKDGSTPTLLLGVTYALLDMADAYPVNFPELIVMETGGMKGRRKELVRRQVHEQLMEGFGVSAIHSEYGMTELLSQAYSKGEGLFSCPPWMRILVRDMNDPFSYVPEGRSGGINIIDLANLYSCAFISTQDIGRLHRDGRFEVLGRFDNSQLRGCNLMIS